MSKRAVVILADGFEEIEAITAIDVLRRAGIDLVICGLDRELVTGAHKVKVAADTTLDKFDHSDMDVIVLPGGSPGAEHLAASKRLKEVILDMYKREKIVAAICASPALVLAPSGILDGKKATCYPGMEERFGEKIKFLKSDVVVDKNIITSRGPATAIAFSLAIVEMLAGRETADINKQRLLA